MLYIFVQHLALSYSMFVLFPRSGNYSGAALDMRFIKHLHLFNVSEEEPVFQGILFALICYYSMS